MPNDSAGAKPAPVTIRAREPGDWQEIADLTSLPKVRFGTLRLPFTSREYWRRLMENPVEGHTHIVAILDGRIVGVAGLMQGKGRRSHRRRNLHVGS